MSTPYPPTNPSGPQQGGGYGAPPGYAPPPSGYAPPPSGYAPPPAGYAPPPSGYTAVPTQYPPPGQQPYPGQFQNPNEQGNKQFYIRYVLYYINSLNDYVYKRTKDLIPIFFYFHVD